MAMNELHFGATKQSDQGTDQPTFLQWMDEQGIVHNKCKLYCFPRTGRGVKAAVSIKAGEVVLEVPDEAVLLAETGSLIEHIVELDITEESELALQSVPLIITAMYEKMRGAGSQWSAYLRFLPQLHQMSLPFTWEEADRHGLIGTSVMHRECCPPFEHPPADVERIFLSTVLPFFTQLALPGKVKEETLRNVFLWATAIVASYSFELGNDKMQDLLNHVTGASNVRLNHCEDSGTLQMIATRNIKKGGELINDYGSLSNGELLRRYGFVEPLSLFHDDLEQLAGRSSVAEQVPGCASTCYNVWIPANKHDAAILPLDLILTALRVKKYPLGLLTRKLLFAKQCGIVPGSCRCATAGTCPDHEHCTTSVARYTWSIATSRYTIDCHGILDGAAAELFRLLAMDFRSFEAFWASVDAWQAPAPAPGASHCRHGMRAEFEERWANLVLSVLALLRAKMRTPTACVAALKGATPGRVQSAAQAAAVVALGEWVAVDCCMARVSGTVVDGLSGRRLFLEADSSLIPGHDAENAVHTEDDLGAAWLLRLSQEWWGSTGLATLQNMDGQSR